MSITEDSGPIESRVKHLLGSVVRAMMSPDASIVASLDNVNGFLAVYTPSDDLIRTDFEKKGVVPNLMLHILEEFVLLLGQHSLNNEIPRMNPMEQSRLGIFLSKEIFEGGMIRIHNDFVQDEVKEYQEKDKIESKPDKNRKRVKVKKSLKQLQLKEEEKPKKTKKNGRKRIHVSKVIQD
nr:hypothetical protein [Tanacetum cinerariifolium]